MLRLGIIQAENHQEADGHSQYGEGKRIVPPQGGEHSANGRVGSRAYAEYAGVQPHGRRPLLAGIYVPYQSRARVPRLAPPTPCNVRRPRRIGKWVTEAHAVPATANNRRLGTSIFFRPHLSANTPRKGAMITPGRVKKVIRSPTWVPLMSSARMTLGKAGVTLLTAITAMSVTPKIICRFLSR